MWVHKKGRSGQSYDELRVNFALHFNKAAPTQANLHKLEEKFLTSSVLDAEQSGRPQKSADADVIACLESQFFNHPENP
jgi:hypothetical protein